MQRPTTPMVKSDSDGSMTMVIVLACISSALAIALGAALISWIVFRRKKEAKKRHLEQTRKWHQILEETQQRRRTTDSPPIELAPIYRPTTEATDYAEIPEPVYDQVFQATVQVHETDF